LGKVVLSSIEGIRQLLDGGAMFGNAPKAMWEKWLTPDSLNRIELACRGLLIQIDSKNILLETGIGAFFVPKLANRYGVTPSNEHVLLTSLNNHGLTHEDIDFVILSHLHFDHAGGLLPAYNDDPERKKLLFPNAKYITGNQAWERALNPHSRDKASYIPEMVDLSAKSNRLILIEPSNTTNELPEEIRHHFRFIESNGHTPGQLHTIVQTETEDIFFCGDLIPATTWAHIPLTMGYDRYPELLVDEKKNLYQNLNLDKTIFYFTHDNKFVGSRIKKNEKQKFQAYDFITQLDKKVF